MDDMETHQPPDPEPRHDAGSSSSDRDAREDVRVEELQHRLDAADPADAPDLAEELAVKLGERLDGDAP